ncbi:MAG: hypothetical protein LBQ63_03170 [Deltaproteobacteria bacterium]|nr:hypothetical protein [Deltaproteobacteria bacterium]
MLEYYRFKVINKLFLKGQTEEAFLQLRELQKRYIELCEENAVLKANAREFEDIAFLARNLIFDGNFYWLITGSIKQGPFCPCCYNRKGQMTRLSMTDSCSCPSCGEVFETVERGAEARPVASGGRALDQSAAVSSLRAIASIKQLEKIRAVHEGIVSGQKTKSSRGTAVLLPFAGDL